MAVLEPEVMEAVPVEVELPEVLLLTTGIVMLVWYRLQAELAASGHESPVQMLWSCAPWAGTTVAAGEHLYPKVDIRASPTAVTSAVATPKEAADPPTWETK